MEVRTCTSAVRSFISSFGVMNFGSAKCASTKLYYILIDWKFESMTIYPWHTRVPFQWVSSVPQGSVPSHFAIRRLFLLVRNSVTGTLWSSWVRLPRSSSTTSESNLRLLTILTYVVSALADPSLTLSAAGALRNLCETNHRDLVLAYFTAIIWQLEWQWHTPILAVICKLQVGPQIPTWT